MQLRSEIGSHLAQIRGRETEKAAALADIQALKETISNRKAEQEREQRRRERLEKESKDIKSVMEMRSVELKARAAQLEASNAKMDGLQESLKVQKGKTDKMLRELDASKGRLQKSEAELREQANLNAAKLAENQALAAETRKMDSDIGQLRQEVTRATKLKDAMLKKLKVIDSERAAVKREGETIRGQAQSLERETEVEKREAAAAKAQAVEARAELQEQEPSSPRQA